MFDVSAATAVGLALLLLVTAHWLSQLLRARDGVPGPIPLPLLGNGLSFVDVSRAHHSFAALAKRFGPVFRVWLGPAAIVVVTSPRDIKHVTSLKWTNWDRSRKETLVFEEFLGEGIIMIPNGPNWRRSKQVIAPLFAHDRLKLLVDTARERADALTARLLQAADSGGKVDIAAESLKLTFDMICVVSFGDLFGAQAAPSGHLPKELECFQAVLEHNLFRFFMPLPYWKWVDTPGEKRFRAALETLQRAIEDRIDKRERELHVGGGSSAAGSGGGDGPSAAATSTTKHMGDKDLLALMLRARREKSGEWLTRTAMRQQILTFLFAGHDTTANMLGWVWWFLGKNPEWEAKCVEEVNRVVGPHTPVRFEHLAQLETITMVLKEVLRLKPSVVARGRVAVEDDSLGGYNISAGTEIMWMPWVVHHNPAIWDNPEEFDPSRFDPSRRHDPFSWIPFGAGARRCIGEPLAMLEGRVVVATVLQAVHLTLVPGQSGDDTVAVTMQPRDGVFVNAQRRA